MTIAQLRTWHQQQVKLGQERLDALEKFIKHHADAAEALEGNGLHIGPGTNPVVIQPVGGMGPAAEWKFFPKIGWYNANPHYIGLRDLSWALAEAKKLISP